MEGNTYSSKNNFDDVNKYDLEERTAKFAEAVIQFCKKIPQTPITTPMITQLTKAGTSQAANYYESTEAESVKDFYHKIGVAKKEVKESKLWLRLLGVAHDQLKDEARKLWKEAHEINLIFDKIRRTTYNKHLKKKIDNSIIENSYS